jgi:hypothetical protein
MQFDTAANDVNDGSSNMLASMPPLRLFLETSMFERFFCDDGLKSVLMDPVKALSKENT